MAVNYSAALKTARMVAVIDAIDADAAPATLEIGTAAMAAVLASISLGDPSFTEADGVITLTGVPLSTIGVSSGTAMAARIKAGDGSEIVTGLTVGTSGADINLNFTTITSGQTVTISDGIITHSL